MNHHDSLQAHLASLDRLDEGLSLSDAVAELRQRFPEWGPARVHASLTRPGNGFRCTLDETTAAFEALGPAR